ncbi:MAG: hypothetical protein IT177_09915 [Acidobacteria bacterium]|nr:hypothetical protein [Acidobacteriota bacterium]
MSERQLILEPLCAALPQALGCGTRYLRVWDAKLGPGGGYADLVVISDEPSVVVVEAKKRTNHSFKANVAGQLLLYLVTAMTATVDERIEGLRKSRWKRNGAPSLESLLERAGINEGQLRDWIEGARASTRGGADGFRAVIATDAWNERSDLKRIGRIVRFLGERGIAVDILEVKDQMVTPVLKGKAAAA